MNFEDLDGLEAQEQVQDDKYEDIEVKGLTFGIIGVGQGGNRIAESFYELGYRKVILFNTTEKDMQSLAVPRKHWVVAKDVEGAGKNPAIGEQAAKDVIPDLIKKMNVIFKNVTNIIICVGAGVVAEQVLVEYLQTLVVIGFIITMAIIATLKLVSLLLCRLEAKVQKFYQTLNSY